MTDSNRYGMTYDCAHVVAEPPARAPEWCPRCGKGQQTAPAYKRFYPDD